MLFLPEARMCWTSSIFWEVSQRQAGILTTCNTSASMLVYWLRTQHSDTHAYSSCQSNPDSISAASQKLKLTYVLSQTRPRRASLFATCWRGDLELALVLGPSWLSCPSMEWHMSLLHTIPQTRRYKLMNYSKNQDFVCSQHCQSLTWNSKMVIKQSRNWYQAKRTLTHKGISWMIEMAILSTSS